MENYRKLIITPEKVGTVLQPTVFSIQKHGFSQLHAKAPQYRRLVIQFR